MHKASEITLARLEAVRNSVKEEYGEEIFAIVGGTMAMTLMSLTSGAEQYGVNSGKCIDAFIKAMNDINRLADEEYARSEHRN